MTRWLIYTSLGDSATLHKLPRVDNLSLHLISSVWIRTHNLKYISLLPLPLDEDFIPRKHKCLFANFCFELLANLTLIYYEHRYWLEMLSNYDPIYNCRVSSRLVSDCSSSKEHLIPNTFTTYSLSREKNKSKATFLWTQKREIKSPNQTRYLFHADELRWHDGEWGVARWWQVRTASCTCLSRYGSGPR